MSRTKFIFFSVISIISLILTCKKTPQGSSSRVQGGGGLCENVSQNSQLPPLTMFWQGQDNCEYDIQDQLIEYVKNYPDSQPSSLNEFSGILIEHPSELSASARQLVFGLNHQSVRDLGLGDGKCYDGTNAVIFKIDQLKQGEGDNNSTGEAQTLLVNSDENCFKQYHLLLPDSSLCFVVQVGLRALTDSSELPEFIQNVDGSSPFREYHFRVNSSTESSAASSTDFVCAREDIKIDAIETLADDDTIVESSAEDESSETGDDGGVITQQGDPEQDQTDPAASSSYDRAKLDNIIEQYPVCKIGAQFRCSASTGCNVRSSPQVSGDNKIAKIDGSEQYIVENATYDCKENRVWINIGTIDDEKWVCCNTDACYQPVNACGP